MDRAERSGGEPQSGFRLLHWCALADNPPRLGCDAVKHVTLLPHPRGVNVDLAGDARHDLIRARGVIETFCDSRKASQSIPTIAGVAAGSVRAMHGSDGGDGWSCFGLSLFAFCNDHSGAFDAFIADMISFHLHQRVNLLAGLTAK